MTTTTNMTPERGDDSRSIDERLLHLGVLITVNGLAVVVVVVVLGVVIIMGPNLAAAVLEPLRRVHKNQGGHLEEGKSTSVESVVRGTTSRVRVKIRKGKLEARCWMRAKGKERFSLSWEMMMMMRRWRMRRRGKARLPNEAVERLVRFRKRKGKRGKGGGGGGASDGWFVFFSFRLRYLYTCFSCRQPPNALNKSL